MKKLKNKEDFQNSLQAIQSHVAPFKMDKGIEQTVVLLMLHGFSTTMSCEGHLPGNGHVDSYRIFSPYVQINIREKIFVKSGRVHAKKADPFLVMREMDEVLTEFNFTVHPFLEKERLEMEFLIGDLMGADSATYALSLHERLKKGWNIHGILCDRGVAGIRTMPQELLNDGLRKSFLARTQDHMKRFTGFLEWSLKENL